MRRKVAVKIITNMQQIIKFIERFEQEAAVIAHCTPPNIVQVHDFNHEGEVYFMVMEYVPAKPWTNGWKRSREPTCGCHSPIPLHHHHHLHAVDYAHQRRMIHRDLKPANVMLNLLNELVLMDFVLPKLWSDAPTATRGRDRTAAYMSPERVRGEAADHRSDILLVGHHDVEMLQRRNPTTAIPPARSCSSISTNALPNDPLVETSTPNSLVNILKRALSKNPDHRFQTAKEMAAALSTAALPCPATDTSPPAIWTGSW
ncbi:MAG: serine/threonine-protein kinase [Chloroflexota bacterium]